MSSTSKNYLEVLGSSLAFCLEQLKVLFLHWANKKWLDY